MITVFIRTALIYIFLIAVMRIMGKRQIGEMQISELVTALMLSELAVHAISDVNLPLSHSIIPVLTLISLEVILTFFSVKSRKVKYLLDGTPNFLIYRGKLDIEELYRLRIGVDELLGELRRQNIAGIADCEYALIEQNGQLSAFEKEQTTLVGIDHPLVIDGNIFEKNVALTKFKLDSVLSKTPLDEIFLLCVDDGDHQTLIKRIK